MQQYCVLLRNSTFGERVDEKVCDIDDVNRQLATNLKIDGQQEWSWEFKGDALRRDRLLREIKGNSTTTHSKLSNAGDPRQTSTSAHGHSTFPLDRRKKIIRVADQVKESAEKKFRNYTAINGNIAWRSQLQKSGRFHTLIVLCLCSGMKKQTNERTNRSNDGKKGNNCQETT